MRQLRLSQAYKEVGAGRTKPLYCACEGSDSQAAGDFILKFLGQGANGSSGPMLEFVASRLARHFGIMVPEPVGVMVDADFAALLGERWPHRADEFLSNVGYNFGCQYLNPYTPWAVNQPIPAELYLDAVNIFAFDALIQNIDRESRNPNLFTHGEQIHVYDHELAFSFLRTILPSQSPWDLADEHYLAKHVFRDALRGELADTCQFEARLSTLSDEVMDGIRNEVLPEWQHEHIDTIETHLRTVRDHGNEFVLAVKGRLP